LIRKIRQQEVEFMTLVDFINKVVDIDELNVVKDLSTVEDVKLH
jgi:hypothetical protein